MEIPKQGVVFLVQYTVKGGMDALQIFILAQEEANDEVNENRVRQVRVFRDRSNPLEEYDEISFIKRFRLTKGTFIEFLKLFRLEIKHLT